MNFNSQYSVDEEKLLKLTGLVAMIIKFQKFGNKFCCDIVFMLSWC